MQREEEERQCETDRQTDRRRNILLEPALYARTLCHWDYIAAINFAWMHLSKDNIEHSRLWGGIGGVKPMNLHPDSDNTDLCSQIVSDLIDCCRLKLYRVRKLDF